MSKVSRREFTKMLGLAGAATVLPSARVLGANEDIRMAAIGLGGKGSQDARVFRELPGVRLVAACDADSAHLEKNLAQYRKTPELGVPEGVVDFRRVLDRKDVDAVVIATPNHLHSLIAILACQAGKDVYVEKPVSQTLWEGRQLAHAARRTERIVQGGTQNRSDVGLRAFYDWFQDRPLGAIRAIHGLCYRQRTGIGKLDSPLTPPETLNYNLWLGPAADEPLYRPRFHYDWHWFWNTGNGDLGNQGPHEFNQILWTLGDFVLPTRVTSFGGRFGWHDAGQTPNMQICRFETAQGIPVTFEVRDMWLKPDLRAMPNYRGQRVGVIIDCEHGTFKGGRGGGAVYDPAGQVVRRFKGDGGGTHQANFIAAVRARSSSILHAPVATNHISDAWHHLANIAFRLGRQIPAAKLREALSDDALAQARLADFETQLAAWRGDAAAEPWTQGLSLAFDGDQERFTGPLADRANALLRRHDRAGFEVPEIR